MSRTDELDQWALAAQLIDEHGDQIGDYVIGEYRECLRTKDYESAHRWLALVEKLNALNWGDGTGPRQ